VKFFIFHASKRDVLLKLITPGREREEKKILFTTSQARLVNFDKSKYYYARYKINKKRNLSGKTATAWGGRLKANLN
jgi:tRNA pseudouridine-54 N-methylase